MSDSLAILSDNLMTVTVVIYSLAMLAYAGEFAFGRVESRAASAQPQRQRVLAGVSASEGSGASGDSLADVPGGAVESAAAGSGDPAGAATSDGSKRWSKPDSGGPPAGSSTTANRMGVLAVVLTVLAWSGHLASIVTRGLAAERWPWGDMYEFLAAILFATVTVFLLVHLRWRVRYLGLLVMVPVVLGLEIGLTVLYSTPGPLVPALHSYWIAIHVSANILAVGAFMIGALATVLYLTVDRYELRKNAGKKIGFSGIAVQLPGKETLDRLAYRTIALGFPLWTFGVIAGAIWAGSAWGRYWGWDPKETWSFITWVIFAGYLHARSTAGWKGRRAAIIALLGIAALLFNLFGVNIWISGLHSYA